jgi:undecaprenyl-diphosphatase
MNNQLWKWFHQIDLQIMDFIRRKLYKPQWSSAMSFASHPPYWRQIALAITLIAFIVAPSVRWQIGLLVLAITISDQTCNLIKALVKRVRPDGDRPTDGGFWQKLGHYSFPSSHCANNFCVAVLTLHWWPYLGIFFYIWASIVTFSRVYLKNHYPSDVIVGGLIGVGYGLLFIKLFS